VTLQEAYNIPEARNRCILEINGADDCVFVDSDVVVHPSFLLLLIEMAESAGIAGIWYKPAGIDENPPKCGVYDVDEVGAGCTLLRSDVIEKVGLFDTTLTIGEDTDYCFRAKKKHGFRILENSTIHVTHLEGNHHVSSSAGGLVRLFKYRRFYSKHLRNLRRRTKMRILIYTALDICILLAFVNRWFLVAPGLYLLFQSVRPRSNLYSAVRVFLDAATIPPIIILGLAEEFWTTQSR
jgi:glycosyltransferase involved in cell wall biosynthesis